MRRFFITLFALATFASCSTSTAPPDAITDDQFVTSMIALRRAARAAGADEAAYAAAREQILASQQISPDDLAAYLTAHADNLSHLAAIWETINEQSLDDGVH